MTSHSYHCSGHKHTKLKSFETVQSYQWKQNQQAFFFIRTCGPYYANWSWVNDINFDLETQENMLKHHCKTTYLIILTKARVFMCLCFFLFCIFVLFLGASYLLGIVLGLAGLQS